MCGCCATLGVSLKSTLPDPARDVNLFCLPCYVGHSGKNLSQVQLLLPQRLLPPPHLPHSHPPTLRTRCGSDRCSQNGQTSLKWLARPAFLPHRRIWSEGSLEIILWTPEIKEWLHMLACDKYESHCIKLYHNLMFFHIVCQEVTQKMKWKYFPSVCLKMARPCCWHNV